MDKISNLILQKDKFINQMSPKFECNRMSGGKIAGGLFQALWMMKSRSLK